jgi:phosphoserine phosphatase
MTQQALDGDPLPSWNDGRAKDALIGFVEQVTKNNRGGFVPPEERIAVFDNDGTLCSEMPVLTQFAFIADRIRALAPDHPEWKDMSPFKEILAGDMIGALAGGPGAISGVLAAMYTGMTTAEFADDVVAWIGTARHPLTSRLYTEMVYQPMLELLAYLRKNLFRTYIVSASGIDFMRPWTEAVYGIPPEQVIGSSIRLKYDDRNGSPVLVRIPEMELFDEGEEKPVAIHHFIGRHPVLAFGDSDGDLQMLRWVVSGSGPRFAGLIHHTDEERVRACEVYDGKIPIGKCHNALTEAKERGWTIVDMKKDWKIVFPFGRCQP